MGKKFNGQKMSHSNHSPARGERKRCPICGTEMKVFLGTLRCTELRRGKGGNSYRTIKHGSMRTIRKRLKEQARVA